MKLFVSKDCDLNTLKILAAANFYCEQLDVVYVSDRKSFYLLPVLETKSGSSYFSSNAICRYLRSIGHGRADLQTESWLEWESSVLQPSVNNLLKTGVPNAELRRNLEYLNAVFSKQLCLSEKNNPDLSDIVIWANVYPLLKASLLARAELPTLVNWLNKLNGDKSLCDAFSKVARDAEGENLKKLLVCDSGATVEFFMPLVIPDFKLKSHENSHAETEKECELSQADIDKAVEHWSLGLNSLPALKEKLVPVLPVEGERNVLITSALPYVNNVPHLGNIIGAVLSADVFARYCRLRNYNTLFVCGTDEYGTATETKAIAAGLTPQQICDQYHALHAAIYEWFCIGFDHFGRTTTRQQTLIAQDMFWKLHKENLVLEDSVEQLYCNACDRFLADRFVEGTCPMCGYADARGDQCDKCGRLINAVELQNPECKLCGARPHIRSSRHLFLDLPKLEPSLNKFLDKSSASWSSTARVIARSWMREGLKPRCITRDLAWGTPVPLPGYSDKVFYVWYDAPIGYLSITAAYTEQWERWWKAPGDVQLFQFMAKDNVPFHAVVFPACQLGTCDPYTTVSHLAATEYLNYEDTKFSKSRGVGVFGDDARDTGLPPDVWRFYLLYMRPETQDTYFSWSDLMLKVNSELLNNLGNFINRALSFVSNNFGGAVPRVALGDAERCLIALVDHELKRYVQRMEKTRLRDAIKCILNISRLGNQYIQANKPWELVKGGDQERERAGTVLGLAANVCALLCTLLGPYMPQTQDALRAQLNAPARALTPDFVLLLPHGHIIGKPAPLFKKIEPELIEELKKKYAGRQSPEKEMKPMENSSPQTNEPSAVPSDINGITNLENAVTAQGTRVRELKAAKASKEELEGEVSLLLQLKQRLSIAKGELPPDPKGKKKKR